MRVSSFALDPLGAKHIPQGLAEFIDPFANNNGQAGEKPPGAIFGVVESEAQNDIGGNGRKRPEQGEHQGGQAKYPGLLVEFVSQRPANTENDRLPRPAIEGIPDFVNNTIC